MIRFFLALSVFFVGHAATLYVATGHAGGGAAGAVHSDASIHREFPNHFTRFTDPKDVIDRSLGIILSHLSIPHVENNRIVYDGFFKKIQDIVDQFPGAKAYISGGMVRSLLGYIYKRLHNTYLQEQSSDEDESLEEITKRIISLKALGVGSDFDILIDFPERTDVLIKDGITKYGVIEAVELFVNSFRNYLRLSNDRSALERTIAPYADVKEYKPQITQSVREGGSALDWLAYPVIGGVMRLPDEHPEIIDDFIHGVLRYLKADTFDDKQTMRGLRALVELPFLSLESQSAFVLENELTALVKQGWVSSEAEEQIQKMIKNARFGGGGNRFAGKQCDGNISVLLKQLAQKVGRQRFLPEFIPQRARIRAASVVDMTLQLMPFQDFRASYTNNGVLYHGTPDISNVLSMIRNGFIMSLKDQGGAAYGAGVYSTKKYSEAEFYAGGMGIVLSFQIKDYARIVDMSINGHRAHYEDWLKIKQIKEENFGDFFKEYAVEFAIDVVVNNYPLIQNLKIVKMPKDFKNVIETSLYSIISKLNQYVDGTKSYELLPEELEKISPASGFGKLARLFGVEINFQGYVDKLEHNMLARIERGENIQVEELRANFAPDSRLQFVAREFEAQVNPKLIFQKIQDNMVRRLDAGEEVSTREILETLHPAYKHIERGYRGGPYDAYGKLAKFYGLDQSEFLARYIERNKNKYRIALYLTQNRVPNLPHLRNNLIEILEPYGVTAGNLGEVLMDLTDSTDFQFVLPLYFEYIGPSKPIWPDIHIGLFYPVSGAFYGISLFKDNETTIVSLIRLYQAKLITKIQNIKVLEGNAQDLQNLNVTSDTQIHNLMVLLETGGFAERTKNSTFALQDLKNLKNFTDRNSSVLLLLFREGVLEPVDFQRDEIPEEITITAEQIIALKALIQAGMKKVSINELKYFPNTLNNEQIASIIKYLSVLQYKEIDRIPFHLQPRIMDTLVRLFQGKIIYSLSIYGATVPEMQENQIRGLEILFGKGLMEPLSVSDLEDVPINLDATAEKVAGLKRLIDKNIMNKLSVFDLRRFAESFSKEQAEALIALHENGVLDLQFQKFLLRNISPHFNMDHAETFMGLKDEGIGIKIDYVDIRDIPENINVTSEQISLVKRLVDTNILLPVLYIPRNFSAQHDTTIRLLFERGLIGQVGFVGLRKLPINFAMTEMDVAFLEEFKATQGLKEIFKFSIDEVSLILEMKRLSLNKDRYANIPVIQFDDFFKRPFRQLLRYPNPIETDDLTIEMYQELEGLQRLVFVPNPGKLSLGEYVRECVRLAGL